MILIVFSYGCGCALDGQYTMTSFKGLTNDPWVLGTGTRMGNVISFDGRQVEVDQRVSAMMRIFGSKVPQTLDEATAPAKRKISRK